MSWNGTRIREAQRCVYTGNELLSLLEHHRRTPLRADELLQIHRGKRMFSGRVA